MDYFSKTLESLSSRTPFEAIPNLLAAIIIFVVFFILAKLVSQVIGQLTTNMNLDKYSEASGVNKILGENMGLSKLIRNLVYFFILFFGLITAVDI